MSNSKNITYIYLIISLIILIIVIQILYKTQNSISKKKYNLSNNTILLEQDDIIIKVKPEMLDGHLTTLKDNLMKLNNKITNSKCAELKQFLINAKKDLANFIDTTNIDKNKLCHYKNDGIFINKMLAKEKKMLKEKMINRRTMTYNIDDDDETFEELESKMALVDIILDIEIITFIIRNSLCNDKNINLDKLYKLIEKIYELKCVKTDDKKEEEENDIDYENFKSHMTDFNETIYYLKYNESYNKLYGDTNYNLYTPSRNSLLEPINIERTTHNETANKLCNESNSLFYKIKSPSSRKSSIYGKSLISDETQFLDSNSRNINKSKKPLNHQSSYDIAHIKNERFKLKKKTTDLNCRRSLSNHYDYFDS